MTGIVEAVKKELESEDLSADHKATELKAHTFRYGRPQGEALLEIRNCLTELMLFLIVDL